MAKSKIALVVDSTSNLSRTEIDRFNIHVIPQILIWENESYRDQVDITNQEFYDKLSTAKELPSTSQPSSGEFHEFFSKVAETSESIVGVFISDELSGTLDSARTAAAMMSDYPIEIVDSRSTSMGLGFIALETAEAIEQGKSFEEVVKTARSAIPRAKAVFVVDTLEFLHRRGRIGGAKRLMGTLLSFKPLLFLENGRIEPLDNIRTKKKALQGAIDYVIKDTAGRGTVRASVIHAAAPDEAGVFLAQVEQQLQPVELGVSELTPVLGANTGPGLIGLAYITSE
ncbi:MAG: DegV family protein [Anaerolineae bacterium]|nr:MAG: DegV family protein [Anaerolineae bacterium]